MAAGLRLEVLAVAALVAIGATDLAMRISGNVRPFAYRGWEAARYNHAHGQPFRPNQRLKFERTWGDLANIAGAAGMRQFRSQTFSTDDEGFRDAGGSAPVDAVMLGDSQGVGAACSDDETIPVQASQILGKRIYNACGVRPDAQLIARLAKRLAPRDKLLIFEWVDRPDRLNIPGFDGAMEDDEVDLPTWAQPFRDQLTMSPMVIAAHSFLSPWRNGTYLANPSADGVAAAPLSNGDLMLFMGRDVNAAYLPRRPQVGYFQWLNHECARNGLKLAVMLLPNKFEANTEVVSRKAPGYRDFPARQAALLRKLGIEAFSAGPALRTAAQVGQPAHQNPFWLDDTHMNKDGNGVVARLLAVHYPGARTPAPSN